MDLNITTGAFADNLFTGKLVVGSGASSDMGQAVTRGVEARGASVTATESLTERLKAVDGRSAVTKNVGLQIIQLDVRDPGQMRALTGRQDAIDVLVAARGLRGPDGR